VLISPDAGASRLLFSRFGGKCLILGEGQPGQVPARADRGQLSPDADASSGASLAVDVPAATSAAGANARAR
jgi:hypothetical protein